MSMLPAPIHFRVFRELSCLSWSKFHNSTPLLTQSNLCAKITP